jgi:type II secretory pathway pseudopilin PulG
VEIVIVAAIMALLAASAVPGFLRARKRSQVSKVLSNLRSLDSGVDRFAFEARKKSSDPVAVSDWTNYLRKGTAPSLTGRDLFGRDHGAQSTVPFILQEDSFNA